MSRFNGTHCTIFDIFVYALIHATTAITYFVSVLLTYFYLYILSLNVLVCLHTYSNLEYLEEVVTLQLITIKIDI